MKRTHLGLAGLVLGTVLLQVGCANLPQTTTGSAPEDAQAMKDHEAIMEVAGLPPTTKTISMGKIGEPIAGLNQAQLAIFGQGKAVFERTFTMEPGDFANDRSCLACHGAGGTGGASDHFAQNVGALTNPYDEAVVAAGAPSLGFLGHLLSNDPAHNPQPLPPAPPGTKLVVSARLAPPAAGDGVLMAIPEYQLRDRAAHQNYALGISGRVGEINFPGLPPSVGRIGWKLRTATLAQFTGGAFINELGVSDTLFPGAPPFEQQFDGSLAPDPNGPDLADQDFDAVVKFQELLAPPAPAKVDVAGLNAFKKAGCIECHWTGYTTATSMDQLPDDLKPFYNIFGGGKQVPAYTDLLAHNMGGGVLTEGTDLTGQGPVWQHKDGMGLSDGVSETVAADEYRTAPLWGLRYRPLFLHDGRAKTIDEAIRQHYYVSPYDHKYDSEANQVVLRYLGKTHNRRYDLSARERYALLSFLRQL